MTIIDDYNIVRGFNVLNPVKILQGKYKNLAYPNTGKTLEGNLTKITLRFYIFLWYPQH